MADILDDLRKVVRLNGDTYSSAEVIGLVGRAADEIERLRAHDIVRAINAPPNDSNATPPNEPAKFSGGIRSGSIG